MNGKAKGSGVQPQVLERAVKMPEQSNDYRVVVFGAGGVGKSSLVLRFVKGNYNKSISKIQVLFFTRKKPAKIVSK
jgi:GTPase SAR1 family protein